MIGLLNSGPARQLGVLYRAMARLTSAGIPPLQAAAVIDAQSSGATRTVARSFAEAWRTGGSLGDAARRVPQVVPAHHAQALLAAERTGTLERTLDALAIDCEAEARARTTAWVALRQPLILFLGIALILPLPLAVRSVASYLFVAGPLVATLALVLWAATALHASARRRRATASAILRSVPGLGDLIDMTETARAFRTIAVSNGAGLPLRETLALAAEAAGPGPIGSGVRQAARAVDRGASLNASLREARLLTGVAALLAAEGEVTGRIDEAFARAATEVEAEMSRKLLVRIRSFGAFLYGLTALYIAYRATAAFTGGG